MPETPNHNYNVPQAGAQNWHRPLNENFRQYDTDIEIRDRTQNLGEYEPKDGAKFLATDTGNVFVGDGEEWTHLEVGGQSDSGPGQAAAPGRAYAEIKGSGGNLIQGNAEVDGRTGLIEVLGFDHSIRLPVDEQEDELQGIRQHDRFSFLKASDKATPVLMRALTNGERLQEATFEWYRGDPETSAPFFTITLEDSKLTAVEMVGGSPQETVSLLYEKITWTITDGNIETSDTTAAFSGR